MIKIKYKNPANQTEFIYENIDDTSVNIADYCNNLHKTVLCAEVCTGYNCMIWMEINGEYVLMGIDDTYEATGPTLEETSFMQTQLGLP